MTELARIETTSHGSTCVVRVIGEIDISNKQKISAAIERELPRNASELVLDMTETGYLDSAGVTLLVRLAERLRIRRQQIRVVAPKGSAVRAVLDLTALSTVMPIEDNAPTFE